LITQASEALKPKFESELKPGTRIVMESFPIPGWKPAWVRRIKMAFIVVFRTLKGEHLLSKTLDKDKEIGAALKLDIGKVVPLEISSVKRDYRIVGIETKLATPQLFGQSGQLMGWEFVVEPI
jgi:hypothetical protein